jgi:galactose-1-phosphate uridylyltransferase
MNLFTANFQYCPHEANMVENELAKRSPNYIRTDREDRNVTFTKERAGVIGSIHI